jgi:hypothetical protein
MTGFNSKRDAAADKAQNGKCKLCIDGCAACDARAQPAQEPKRAVHAKYRELYDAVSDMVCEVGRAGTIDPRNPLVNNVMSALYRIDGGIWIDPAKTLDIEVEPLPVQPAQESVAHVYLFDDDGRPLIAWDNAKGVQIGDKLYTAPPQRPWVGLTVQERNDCLVNADPCECLADPEAHQLMVEVEAKLKERNS